MDKSFMTVAREKLALELFDSGALKLVEELKQKNHANNPDLPLQTNLCRLQLTDILSNKSSPKSSNIVAKIGYALFDFAVLLHIKKFDQVVGIPPNGVKLAEAFSLAPKFCHHVRLLKLLQPLNSKQSQIIIEGAWNIGEIVVVIDAAVNPAADKLKTIKVLENSGLKVRDILAVIDYEQGDKEMLEENGYNCYSLFQATQLIDILLSYYKINKNQAKRAKEYLVFSRIGRRS